MSTAEISEPKPRTRRKSGEPLPPITLPFTIIRDSREQDGYNFTGIVGDAKERGRQLIVPVEIGGLRTGDYSVKGLESLVTVERKSASDLFYTLSSGRDRFEAEHVRMKEIIERGGHACVVVEADWSTILNHPPQNSRLLPLAVFRTAISWTAKYKVSWWCVPGKRFAELTTFSILRKFYEQWQENQTNQTNQTLVEDI